VFYALYRLLGAYTGAGAVLLVPLWLLASINLFVGIFNLLPGFPLDGGRVLRAALWKITGDLRKATRIASYGGQGIAILMGVGGAALLFTQFFISGIWLVLIAAFVFQLSRSAYKQTLLQIAVADTQVKDLMFTQVPLVDESTTLTDLRNHYFNIYHLPALPVTDHEGRLLGLVSRDDLAAVNPSEWDVLSAGRVAHPVDEDQVVSQDARLDKVLKRAMRADQFMLVMDDGRVQGILTVDELMRYIRSRVSAPPGK
jgi:CBS domain-containing protein